MKSEESNCAIWGWKSELCMQQVCMYVCTYYGVWSTQHKLCVHATHVLCLLLNSVHACGLRYTNGAHKVRL